MPDQQFETSLGTVRFPQVVRSPWWALTRRLLMAFGVLAATVLLVYLDRDGYRDANDPTREVSLLDCIYYTTVTLSTTGYGDITPMSDGARLVNAFVVTPLRIAFLVLLIGTTLEVLASQGREMFRVTRWRKQMDQHVVVVGYGTKGRSAIDTLVNNGHAKDRIVVVDPDASAVQEATNDGLTVVVGDATRRDVLRRAGVASAAQIIITTDRDDSTVLSVLNARQLNPRAYVVAAVREGENVPLVRQSGADAVVTSSDAVGRLLGLSSVSPALGSVIEDLLTYGQGLEVAERELLVPEVGKQPQQLPDQVIAVVRDNRVHRYFEPVVTQLARGRPGHRRTPRARAALGAAARHPRRGHRRGGLSGALQVSPTRAWAAAARRAPRTGRSPRGRTRPWCRGRAATRRRRCSMAERMNSSPAGVSVNRTLRRSCSALRRSRSPAPTSRSVMRLALEMCTPRSSATAETLQSLVGGQHQDAPLRHAEDGVTGGQRLGDDRGHEPGHGQDRPSRSSGTWTSSGVGAPGTPL